MGDTADELVAEWVAHPENTARSMLVTVFGDTVIPVATRVWLAQLFELTGVFGFSGRLVRTSMFRLAAENWLSNERVGRQSRYTLTPTALEESQQASMRIYHETHPDWSGRWSVVLLNAPTLDDGQRGELRTHLGWHGFVELGSDVLASPSTSVTRTAELCELAAAGTRLPIGEFEFAALDDVVADGFFDHTLALADTTAAYAAFVDFHNRVADTMDGVSGPTAFGLRSMLIHDLRRIKLGAPDLPAELLPADWAGTEAYALAGRMYPLLSAAAAPWLSQVLDVEYPSELPHRFR